MSRLAFVIQERVRLGANSSVAFRLCGPLPGMFFKAQEHIVKVEIAATSSVTASPMSMSPSILSLSVFSLQTFYDPSPSHHTNFTMAEHIKKI